MSGRFDAEGTQPGLIGAAPVEKVINLKCRSPRSCDSMEATEVKIGGAEHHGQRLYRCVKCGHTWGVSVGGHFDY
jgi:DNA-directed RNA polymerase subunit M/transcription elongation factor TFIIS